MFDILIKNTTLSAKSTELNHENEKIEISFINESLFQRIKDEMTSNRYFIEKIRYYSELQ